MSAPAAVSPGPSARLVVPAFTVLGPPRTKKNSPQIVPGLKHPLLVPSEAYKRWLKVAIVQVPGILTALLDAGVELPITAAVNVRAVFFRQSNTGDAVGYYQALGDFLQMPKSKLDKKTGKMKIARHGAGILVDDRQIVHWAGSRLDKDSFNPRIEVSIEIVDTWQPGLFDDEPEE
jgi:hypothetical protein